MSVMCWDGSHLLKYVKEKNVWYFEKKWSKINGETNGGQNEQHPLKTEQILIHIYRQILQLIQ